MYVSYQKQYDKIRKGKMFYGRRECMKIRECMKREEREEMGRIYKKGEKGRKENGGRDSRECMKMGKKDRKWWKGMYDKGRKRRGM